MRSSHEPAGAGRRSTDRDGSCEVMWATLIWFSSVRSRIVPLFCGSLYRSKNRDTTNKHTLCQVTPLNITRQAVVGAFDVSV